MFFIKIGSFIAKVLVGLGALRIAMGFFVAITFDTHESMVAASKRYLVTTNSGEAINQGMWMLAAGVVFGLLAKIAKNTRH